MALDVKVTIELSKAVGTMGFGIPLLLESGAEIAVDYTECSSLEDVVTAGYTEDTEMYKAANMLFMQENCPAKIAVCSVSGTTVEALPSLISNDWRQLVLVGAETTTLVSAADYIETTDNKILFISMDKTAFNSFKTSVSSKKYNRTVIFVNSTENAAAALVGETAGREAGSFTYKFITLKNVTPEKFTDSEISALHESGAFGYTVKAGDNVTTEGISQSGRYIDITDSIDYVIQNIEYRVQKLLNNGNKVPYTDRGINQIANETDAVLKEAYLNGIIAEKEDGTPDYTVSFSPRSATTEADRASRVYNYGKFEFGLAGAIHDCRVFGTVKQ